ncbi:hypothetical protein I6B53_10500 [Schaalia sp. 19OD2882]|uniref:hypothetical protein n=1 Tax=Schaalia sp. 19OD2882 TaxID=2794089 RepID=UPI001C1EA724|nr:hypothetical protein [Schaalia sp. 19OD2882]QWW19491.1 hypothetical protein I6B53_10500 [Schaalia sp. 19OD2882]
MNDEGRVGARVLVAPRASGSADDEGKPERIPIRVGGDPVFNVTVLFECTSSPNHGWMVIEKSSFVLRVNGRNEPLLRWEYDRNATCVPMAHMHIHAHQDSWTFAMMRSGKGSRRHAVGRRKESLEPPKLADFHIPTGGPRLRPSFEDFLEMLIQEFGVDHEDDAIRRIACEREAWRETQLKSMVQSLHKTSADALREIGYLIEPPSALKPENRDWLDRF